MCNDIMKLTKPLKKKSYKTQTTLSTLQVVLNLLVFYWLTTYYRFSTRDSKIRVIIIMFIFMGLKL